MNTCLDQQQVIVNTDKMMLFLSDEDGVRSVLQEQSTALGLGMFALLVQRCTDLLRDTPAGTHTVVTLTCV